MARTRTTHSTEEWMELITECRRSGMSDADWCRQNNIPTSSFYNAVCRLRKKACEIPVPSDDTAGRIVNPAAGSPDVVPIRIEPEVQPVAAVVPSGSQAAPHLDNSHRIEIRIGNACIRVCNGTDPALLSAVIGTLGRTLLC